MQNPPIQGMVSANAACDQPLRILKMTSACLLAIALSACGWVSDSDAGDVAAATAVDEMPFTADADSPEKAVKPSTGVTMSVLADRASSGSGSTAPTTVAASSVTATTPVAKAAAESNWQEIAIRDMRAADGSYARNEDKLLHRTMVSPSSQAERASLAMGRFGTPAAFTNANPDYAKELSWVSMSDPVRYLEAWPRLNLWDQVYLSERYGALHAPGYTGNSRVRTWGYEMWVKSKAGVWRRLFKTDGKSGEAWRPTFKGGASFASTALDLRKESDGSTSVRPLPALGLDSSGTYWIPHGYAGGIQAVDANDVGDILVLCWSQLVLDDQSGVDDRKFARFLLAVGVDWYPPSGMKLSTYPGSGTSRHKYVTIEPRLHVMHTMTEAEFRANPPPR